MCVSGIFPEADKDPVIQIANMVIRQGDSDPFIRNVFTLNTCSPVVGSQVLSFPREQEMLRVSERREQKTCLGNALVSHKNGRIWLISDFNGAEATFC